MISEIQGSGTIQALNDQIKLLTEENEDMLLKLGAQDQLTCQIEDLKQRYESMAEELESSQKACDYY